MNFKPTLLQTTEVVRLTSDAASTVGKHAATDAFTALLWLLIVGLAGISIWQWRVAEKAQQRERDVIASQGTSERANMAAARVDWAQEMAFNTGHAADLQARMREQYERQIKDLADSNERAHLRLEKINQELRVQESKSTEVLGATGQKMREIANALTLVANNQTEMLYKMNQLTGFAPMPPRIFPAID